MIEARRLHILRALSDHRTVTAAAAALHLTPSAVSQQLAALEQETRHRLVERSGRGVRLTPAGDILLRHTNAVLAQLERAEAELVAYSSGAAGTVTVASFATGISLAVAPALVRLARVAPGIKVRVQDAEGDASLRMVLDRQVDVAVAVEYRGAPHGRRRAAGPRASVRGTVRRRAPRHAPAHAAPSGLPWPNWQAPRGSAPTRATRAVTWWCWPARRQGSSRLSSTSPTTSTRLSP